MIGCSRGSGTEGRFMFRKPALILLQYFFLLSRTGCVAMTTETDVNDVCMSVVRILQNAWNVVKFIISKVHDFADSWSFPRVGVFAEYSLDLTSCNERITRRRTHDYLTDAWRTLLRINLVSGVRYKLQTWYCSLFSFSYVEPVRGLQFSLVLGTLIEKKGSPRVLGFLKGTAWNPFW